MDTPRPRSPEEIIPVNKRVPLYEEYRLIERSENEINGAWKGAQMLLFFLAFVFGSFCTFCFHMLMYLFDEKCVLFPKLMSLTRVKHNVIYEFMPSVGNGGDLPVDFVSTQWVEKSTCSLPTYVPLVSGIFGLVWTTMFLMCSTGSRTLTGLQRPWRVLPPVFLFSLAMGCLCVHSSAITHSGLQELCRKLGEITGNPTCTYTVNVATLSYERRIRGVYQATRLTIVSAWLHTACWLLSALLALVRVLLAVDFLLVRVTAELHGDIDNILEKNEVQLRSVSPQTWVNNESECASDFMLTASKLDPERSLTKLVEDEGELIFMSTIKSDSSEPSLVPEEWKKIVRKEAVKRVPKDKAFIVRWLHRLVDELNLPDHTDVKSTSSTDTLSTDTIQSEIIPRQFGKATMSFNSDDEDETKPPTRVDSIIFYLSKKKGELVQLPQETSPQASTSRPRDRHDGLKSEEHRGPKKGKKSNLKSAVGVQTDKRKHKPRFRVQIGEKHAVYFTDDDEPEADDDQSTEKGKTNKEVDKETQTKEKQD